MGSKKLSSIRDPSPEVPNESTPIGSRKPKLGSRFGKEPSSAASKAEQSPAKEAAAAAAAAKKAEKIDVEEHQVWSLSSSGVSG